MLVNLYLPFSLMIAISIICIPISFCQENGQYVGCSELFHCGSLRDIGYPFYGENRPRNCGYPGFELTCETDVPFISFGDVNYRVIEVDNTTHTLRIARDDLSDLCPTHLYNTSLDFNIFNYDTNYPNITLHYGCSQISAQAIRLPNQFDCSVNGSTSISFYSTFNVPVSTLFNVVRCNNSIDVPVNRATAQSLANLSLTVEDLRIALASGFGLEWSANNTNCDRCTRVGGRCGFDPTSSSFVCYCPDGPYPFTCNNVVQAGIDTSENKKPLGIGLGVASAVVASFGIVGAIVFCRQRRKKGVSRAALAIPTENKDLSTSPMEKNLSSHPSDTFTRSIPSYPSQKSDLGRGSSYFGVQVFSYGDLEEATDHFHPSRELGDGGFGAVYHGTLPDGRVVAVKRLYENNFKRVEQFMNEVQILARLRHKNLVLLYGCTSKSSQELLLVYEFIPNGTIADHLHGKRANSGLISWPIRLNIAVETAEALAYLHESDIIHRDVKTTNILLDNGFHVKVADFGLSRLFPTDCTHVSTAPQGTPGYVDPEYYQCYQLTEKSDVYSFGVVLIELISSLQAVDTNRHRLDINLANMAVNKIQNHALHELVDQSLGFDTDSSVRRKTTRVAELAFRCLQQERDMRPSMQEVLVALREIQNEEVNAQNEEVVEIVVDDVALLKDHMDSPSPDSVGSGKGMNSSTSNSMQ